MKIFKLHLFISFLFLIFQYPSSISFHSNLLSFSFIKVKSPCCKAMRRIRRRLCCCCCSTSCDSDSEDELNSSSNTSEEQGHSNCQFNPESIDLEVIPPPPPFPAPQAPVESLSFSPPPSQEEIGSSFSSEDPDSLPSLPPPPPPVLPKPRRSVLRRVLNI
ncbi:hypothetical protein [Cryptosporidium parvum Iowa II]|uniref:Uncharacterized protein n=2 Tax=Cryptosporidium parvum TaxID=5807 RepID=Q5CQN6_CRYPI|nr:hypothetical protein [Cryptosporidium parvum Iowa II]EAK87709.1 hypothetical protein cgd4_10 [Cryptosporidium parvum Iowa II]QOY41886.1 Uncharacterized protein CPATCC_0017090 [Cryptosporidium parvum]WRK32142.1 Uncharacterized protein cpbgf_40010 [Cryptosporidium parvum]|eukprot:QOY41886.1 hypothetical protein CPATCC_001472 [Cryptosporidium parvum]